MCRDSGGPEGKADCATITRHVSLFGLGGGVPLSSESMPFMPPLRFSEDIRSLLPEALSRQCLWRNLPSLPDPCQDLPDIRSTDTNAINKMTYRHPAANQSPPLLASASGSFGVRKPCLRTESGSMAAALQKRHLRDAGIGRKLPLSRMVFFC